MVPVGYRFDSGSGDEMEFHSNGDDRGGTCWGIVPIVARFGEQGLSRNGSSTVSVYGVYITAGQVE